MWLLEPSDPQLKWPIGPHTVYLFSSLDDARNYIQDRKSVEWSLRFIAIYVPPPPQEDSNQKVTQPLVPLSRAKDE